ncbi:MAG: aspartate aminotransferase family protein [Anaerovoracaceae bacterium]|nr:aspartate aminotransferase family protein [Anaerovoracaceae bacterium]
MSDKNCVLSLDFHREYPRVVSGKGIYMYKEDGTEIIDGASGPVLVSLGHGNEEIADAMKEQATKLAFAHRDDCVTPVLEESCRLIAEASDYDLAKIFQVCGGSEATEMAIKMARRYHIQRGNAGKYKIISRWQSYHGISNGALAVSGFAKRRKGYEPYLPEMGHIQPAYTYRPWIANDENYAINCARALENEIMAQGPDTVAAFIAEPISGMSLCAAVPPEGYFEEIRRICDKYDVLLILDEVMTGMGRTGKMFAYKHFNIVPDIVTMGKSISGGYFPLAAVGITQKVYEGMAEKNGNFPPGFSWSGNPLGAAVNVAVMKYLKKHNLVDNCAKMGDYLKAQLEKKIMHHPIVGDIRGKGLMIGVELVKDKATKESFPMSEQVAFRIQEAALEDENMLIEASQGCNKGQAGDGLVISPAFIINKEQIDDIVDRLDKAISTVEKELGY